MDKFEKFDAAFKMLPLLRGTESHLKAIKIFLASIDPTGTGNIPSKFVTDEINTLRKLETLNRFSGELVGHFNNMRHSTLVDSYPVPNTRLDLPRQLRKIAEKAKIEINHKQASGTLTSRTNADLSRLPNKPHEAKPPFGWRALLVFWRALFFDGKPIRIEPARGEEWNRGNYLVNAVAHCEECHTPRNFLGALKTSRAFSGNINGPDRQNAPNITSAIKTGIGSWSIADIEQLLKTGMTPESDIIGSGMKAVVQGTSKLTDADRHAMAIYLKSIPPIHVDLPPPTLASQKK